MTKKAARRAEAANDDTASRANRAMSGTLTATEIERTFPALALDHPLKAVLDDAFGQCTRGKGDARHGQGRDFMEQDWRAIANRHGPAFLSGQAEKKLREALRLEHPQRREELLGTIVYVAMLVIFHDEKFRGRP